MTAKDPYRYFRVEAREILAGLNQGLLRLEKEAPDADLVGRLLRLAHTLKGASRVVRQAPIAQLAHALEDALGPHREPAGPVPRSAINEALSLLEKLTAEVDGLDRAEPPRPAGPDRPEDTGRRAEAHASAGGDGVESVRVFVRDVDRFLDDVSQVSTRLSRFRLFVSEAERARTLARRLSRRIEKGDAAAPRGRRLSSLAEELEDGVAALGRSLGSGVESAERELSLLRRAAAELRLVPASTLFDALERTALDAARSLGKSVAFSARGGEARIDAHVLGPLREALLHAVRNAVAHGIETEAERRESGKAPKGRIDVSVERRGPRMTIACADDGRGIDVDAIREAALRRGVLAPPAAADLDLDAAVRLLLDGGLSTRKVADQLAGRGLGLPVVRETAARLKGEVSVRSEPGRGTTVEIRVPVTISSTEVIGVEAGGAAVGVPFHALVRVAPLSAQEVTRSGDADSIVFEDRAIPFVLLARILGSRIAAGRASRRWVALVLRSSGRTAALGVDRILGARDVVVRGLPPPLPADPLVLGTALESDGRPFLVLDADGLVSAASGAFEPLVPAAPEPRPPVLVVDDSLTTRMLEQSILESAGYAVDLATSAEEALGMARRKRYGAFIVDVEMPGMDGFEFVSVTRSDPALRDVPAVMVTSVDTPEARRRGEDAGAADYIVKGEFDQDRLLGVVRSLTRTEGGERK